MPGDKYSAVWVSHSSISDFLACPRAYFLKNIYRDPQTGHKIQLMSPPLALGQAVHEVVESLSVLPTEKRFTEPLLSKFERVWQRISGKRGGFPNLDIEQQYKERGKAMLRKVMDNPGPIAKPAIKIKENLPQFWLSEQDNIMLCGKIDWLEYLAETDSVHIIDFKTSKQEEHPNSLQLPIYSLLAHYCQRRPVTKASYWYLDFNNSLEERNLPDLAESQEKVLNIAKQIKLARQLERFKCPNGDDGCRICQKLERVVRGEAELIGSDDHGRDAYVLWDESGVSDEDESVLL